MRAQRAIIRCAKHVVDRIAIFGKWEEHRSVKDTDAAKGRGAFDDQAAPRRNHLRHRDISVPANVSVGQSAAAKLTPTTTKCERSIDHPTAISRQFAPSSPRKK